jgi:hypothetical protein
MLKKSFRNRGITTPAAEAAETEKIMAKRDGLWATAALK